MTRPILPRPTAPVVINLIALSIVLGGHAIASSGRGVVGNGDIAQSALTARTFGEGVVTTRNLHRAAVDEDALRRASVVGRAIKLGAVRGLSLAGVNPIGKGVPDADPAGDGGDSTWTSSNASVACPAGSQLIGGGLARGGPLDGGNGRAFIQSSFPSATDPVTWVGQISTDTGGTSGGNVVALCLAN